MENKGYQVIDSKTGQAINSGKVYATRKAASKVADRLDLQYGAVRYSVRFL